MMIHSFEPLCKLVVAMMYFGDVVFAVTGALKAARHRMDILGCSLVGAITGIGGGTIRDLLLGRGVWWVENPLELLLCVGASVLTFFFFRVNFLDRAAMVWCDALGLAAFAVVGCQVSLLHGAAISVSIFMGMLTATGGGVIRDVLLQIRPMILCGEVYATAALAGALGYVVFLGLTTTETVASLLAFLVALVVRGIAIVSHVHLGSPGEFLQIGDSPDDA